MIHRRGTICFILDPVNLSSGAYTSTKSLTDALSEAYKIIVICDDSPSAHAAAFSENVHVNHMPSRPLFFDRNQWLALPSRRQLEEIFRNQTVDLVHTMMPTLASLRAMSAAGHLGIGVVAHSHTQPENFMPHVPRCLHVSCKHLFYTYLNYVYSKADVVICPSAFAESLLRAGNSFLPTQVISNGVDLNRFAPARFSDFGDGFRLLYVGRLAPEKDVATLVRSLGVLAERFPQFQLSIIGEGGERGRLELLSRDLHLEDQVQFLGRVTEARLLRTYQESDLFVLPSSAELEGKALLEAMACGKPVLVANAPDSASRYLVSENGLLFEPGNHVDLACKIECLWKDSAARKEMGKKSRESANHFDISTSIARLSQIYDSLIRDPQHNFYPSVSNE
jgi:glycosyltransferase involved in cell wall biosynthesis